MIKHIVTSLIVDVLIIFIEWRNLQKAGKVTRWMTYAVIGLGTVIWIYYSSALHIFYPTKWLNKAIKPFDSIP